MQLNNNFFIHSLAGSGKTTRLVKYALRLKYKKIIITTYTNKNLEEIKNKFFEIKGYIPSNIRIITWFSFLLDELSRPYQKLMGVEKRISNICFTPGVSARYIPESNIKNHYFNNSGDIYNDKIAKFSFNCMLRGTNVIERLESVVDYLFIDEAQDLSGFDFNIIDKILDSNIKSIMVGDARQNTFNTSPSRKNKKHSNNIYGWFKEKEQAQKGILKTHRFCWRCNTQICNFSSDIYPELERAISKNHITTGHDGIFYIKKKNLQSYLDKFAPLVLVNDIRVKRKLPNIDTMNFGLSKGLTVDRVLIVPTEPIKKYLKRGSLPDCKDKFYIAVTRARYSIAFLIDDGDDLSKFHFSNIIEFVP